MPANAILRLVFFFSRWGRLKTITRVGVVTIVLAIILIMVSTRIDGGAFGGLALLALGCTTIPDYGDPIYQG
jgi:multisubunit Na+/H+ antiporter MnhG subunit